MMKNIETKFGKGSRSWSVTSTGLTDQDGTDMLVRYSKPRRFASTADHYCVVCGKLATYVVMKESDYFGISEPIHLCSKHKNHRVVSDTTEER